MLSYGIERRTPSSNCPKRIQVTNAEIAKSWETVKATRSGKMDWFIGNPVVKHARMEQVIVPMHDIVFFHRLKATAEAQKVSLEITTL